MGRRSSSSRRRRARAWRRFWITAVLAAALFLLPRFPDAWKSFGWGVSPFASPEAPAAAASGTLKVHFLDVGQADSEFIELPNGTCILIDAGNPENGADIVSAVKGYGYSKIDFLIATHPHSDHIGGMKTVVESLEIGAVYMPRTSEADTPTTSLYKNLLAAIQKKGLKINTAKAGVTLPCESVNASFLAPNGTDYGDLNQYSAVLLLVCGSNRFLFMGDAGTVSEDEITADVKADVLKVGHHGSSTSTGASFLQRVRPEYAVIEVGKDNDYGHPAQSTLSRLKKAGASIYRTDRLGTVTFVSDGTKISVDKTPAD